MTKTKIFKLFKLQIDDIFNLFKIKNYKLVLGSLIKIFLIMAAIYLPLYLMLQRVAAAAILINVEFFSLIITVVMIILTISFAINTVKRLFLSNNNDALVILPVTPNQIFISKLLVVYVTEIVYTTIIIVPLFIVINTFGDFGWQLIYMLPLMIIILPLAPLAIASTSSLFLYKIYDFFKEKAILTGIIVFILITIGLTFYIRALGDLSEFDFASNQIETIIKLNRQIQELASANPFFLNLTKAIFTNQQHLYIGYYLIFSIIVFIIGVIIIRPFFFKASMEVYELNLKPKNPKAFKRTSPLISLIKKEALIVIRTPGCLFKYFVFTILMPICAILYNHLLLSMDVVTNSGKTMIYATHLLVVGLLAMLSNVYSASAISKEGRSFIIMKMAPVNYYLQTLAKLLFNYLITSSAVIITGIVVFAFGKFLPQSINGWIIIATTLIVLIISLGHLSLSYELDLRKPTLSWDDQENIEKVNSNTTKSIIWSIGLSLLLCLLVMTLTNSQYLIGSWIIIIILSLAFTTYQLYRLVLRISFQYEEIEV